MAILRQQLKNNLNIFKRIKLEQKSTSTRQWDTLRPMFKRKEYIIAQYYSLIKITLRQLAYANTVFEYMYIHVEFLQFLLKKSLACNS